MEIKTAEINWPQVQGGGSGEKGKYTNASTQPKEVGVGRVLNPYTTGFPNDSLW